ncbi:MAG: DNA recombination protein RmuC [Verrucomicrobia bacterium]|nr:DNA recombination protein RmuC [Verrucomicrobiota bacterium]
MWPFVYLAVGLTLGGIIGWFIGLRSAARSPEEDRFERELKEQATRAQGELESLRRELGANQSRAAAAEASRTALSGELAESKELARSQAAELEALRDRLQASAQKQSIAETQLAAAAQRLLEQQSSHAANLAQLREEQARATLDLREAFKALSADALRQVQPEFLRLANETLSKFAESAKGDLAQRQQSIATLLKPLEEHLTNYQTRLQQSESSQSSMLGEVRKQLETLAQQSNSLSTETLELRRVLSSNQARGRWGEETLRRVVESAGMSAHCDFTEQAQSDDSKPDLLIHLPGERVIIVDAKVPDLEFLQALEGRTVAERTALLDKHASSLRQTIKGLADREYPSRFPNSLDFVVLFLPAESLFSAALEADRALMIWAQNRHILLATPTSLMAILRSVSVSWQQYAQNQNARDIALAGQELYTRVCKFLEHFERIRDGLDKTSNAYNLAVGSFERSLRPSAERMKELGAGVEGRDLPAIAPLQTPLREPPAVRVLEAPAESP